MTRHTALILILLVFVPFSFSQQAETDLGQRVWVRPLSTHTWVIRSISRLGEFGDVESNALLVAGDKESILIDTLATNEQTALVLDWATQQLQHPVRALIVTHWHQDRIGGIDVVVKRGIAAYALRKTIRLAREHHLTTPEYQLRTTDRVTIPGARVETFYPGHGHTVDNIVVWIPSDGVLDGGCFVKSAGATSLGNTQEINPATWVEGIQTLQRRYKSAGIVVPGHGNPGGQELLTHTAKLLSGSR